MLGYLLIGTNDLEKAVAFYEELLSDLSISRLAESDRIILWAAKDREAAFGVCLPSDGNAATNGNGTMPAIPVGSREAVDKFYEKAIDLGATQAAGTADNEGFYGKYIRDLDNNKICFYHIPAPS